MTMEKQEQNPFIQRLKERGVYFCRKVVRKNNNAKDIDSKYYFEYELMDNKIVTDIIQDVISWSNRRIK